MYKRSCPDVSKTLWLTRTSSGRQWKVNCGLLVLLVCCRRLLDVSVVLQQRVLYAIMEYIIFSNLRASIFAASENKLVNVLDKRIALNLLKAFSFPAFSIESMLRTSCCFSKMIE
jgi:hypothetical protein